MQISFPGRFGRVKRGIFAGLCLAIFVSCKDSVGPTPVPAAVASTQGMEQTGAVGLPLSQALVVRIKDDRGKPVKGVAVTWQVEAGEGTVAPGASTSDEAGDASAAWTLGPIAGPQRISATVNGLTPVMFSATGTPGQLAAVTLRGSTDTLKAVGDTLNLEAIGTDRFGNRVSAGFVWASTNPNVVEVDNSGVARARTKGTVQISAASAGITASKALHVTATAVAGAVGSGGGAVTHPSGAQITVPTGDSVTVRMEYLAPSHAASYDRYAVEITPRNPASLLNSGLHLSAAEDLEYTIELPLGEVVSSIDDVMVQAVFEQDPNAVVSSALGIGAGGGFLHAVNRAGGGETFTYYFRDVQLNTQRNKVTVRVRKTGQRIRFTTAVRLVGAAACDNEYFLQSAPEESNPTGSKPPVIFIHGYQPFLMLCVDWKVAWNPADKGAAVFRHLNGDSLQDHTQYWLYSYPTFLSHQTAASRLAALIERQFPGRKDITLIAHSTGGVVARAAFSQFGLDDHVLRVITLGSPHDGADIADPQVRFRRFPRTQALRELEIGTEFLRSLQNDQALRHRYYTFAGTIQPSDLQVCHVITDPDCHIYEYVRSYHASQGYPTDGFITSASALVPGSHMQTGYGSGYDHTELRTGDRTRGDAPSDPLLRRVAAIVREGLTPSVTTISTSPNPPTANQRFSFTVSGTGFASSSADVLFTGPGCPSNSPCVVPNNVLTTKAATTLTGPATVAAGTYTIQVRNGSSGLVSNARPITVASPPPALNSISTNPAPPVAGQQFAFTLSGSGFDGATAQVLFTGPGCPSTAPCVVPNGVLTTKSASTLAGPATISSGSYTIRVRNGSGGAPSNGVTLSVPSAAPTITGIGADPNPPRANQQFAFTLSGSGFDPFNAEVVFTGPGCPDTSSCVVPNNVLTTKTAGTLVGPATISSGSYNVQVRNGSGGTLSNGRTITVPDPPSISSISTSPSPPAAGQQFTFTINGSGFDAASAQVVFTGPGCPNTNSCIVPNSVLTTKTAATLAGPATLSSGSYSVQVRNGSAGTLSTGHTIMVASPTPAISSITTSPSPPTPDQRFTFTISGSGFNGFNAEVVFTGPGCPTTSSCVVPNDVLTTRTATTIAGPATVTSGSYTVQVRNGSGGSLSNAGTITVPGPPSVKSITTSPNPPVAGQQFTFTIGGSSFNSSTAEVVFTGPGCPNTSSCVVPNSVLTTKSSGTLVGPATISSGSYTVQVRNGSGGSLSNAVTILVPNPTPSIGSISTNPSPPKPGQQFAFTINGSGFNSFNAEVVFTGPGCPTTSSCVVPNNVLTTKAGNTLVGPATISTGSYSVQVRNGSGGTLSNAGTVTVP